MIADAFNATASRADASAKALYRRDNSETKAVPHLPRGTVGVMITPDKIGIS